MILLAHFRMRVGQEYIPYTLLEFLKAEDVHRRDHTAVEPIISPSSLDLKEVSTVVLQ